MPEAPAPKLLFDEHLAPRLAGALADLYPGSAHLRDEALEGAADTRIWEHAARSGFVLVTKDEDFHRLSVVRGFPPKVIWIRLGNRTTADVVRLLRDRREEVAAFVQHDEAAFLALG